MNKIYLFLIYLLLIQSVSGATFKELQEIPHDSTNFKEMRIWIPVESHSCKVKVKILDSQMNQVRHLVDKIVKNGYYNIYWDKKDDSGNFVTEGTYKVSIISCTFKRVEDIVVQYQKGENAVVFTTNNDFKNPTLELKLLYDSLYISLDILNIKKGLTDSLFADSLFVVDSVSITWDADSLIRSGRYFYRLKVNEFEHLIPFRYKK